MDKLKVGDRIYSESRGQYYGIDTIIRVTEKFAFSEKGKYRIDIKEGSKANYVEISPSPAWSPYSYYLENDVIKKEYAIQKYTQFMTNRVRWSKMDYDSLKQIYAIIKANKEYYNA